MIIGYRSVKRTDVTGSVQVRGIASPQTKMMAMADNASADLTNMLAGKAAGLMFEEEMSQEIGQTADDVESGNTPNYVQTSLKRRSSIRNCAPMNKVRFPSPLRCHKV